MERVISADHGSEYPSGVRWLVEEGAIHNRQTYDDHGALSVPAVRSQQSRGSATSVRGGAGLLWLAACPTEDLKAALREQNFHAPRPSSRIDTAGRSATCAFRRATRRPQLQSFLSVVKAGVPVRTRAYHEKRVTARSQIRKHQTPNIQIPGRVHGATAHGRTCMPSARRRLARLAAGRQAPSSKAARSVPHEPVCAAVDATFRELVAMSPVMLAVASLTANVDRSRLPIHSALSGSSE